MTKDPITRKILFFFANPFRKDGMADAQESLGVPFLKDQEVMDWDFQCRLRN